MLEGFAIGLAFVCGLLVRSVGLPPLVGFLLAGFGLNYIGSEFGVLPEFTGDVLHYVAHWGVLLLLFSVGLKLRIGQITQSHVLSGGLIHFVISVAIFSAGLVVFSSLGWSKALLLGCALAFSSTVLAAKILEGKRELASFHGRTAIGILIIQDLLALLLLSTWGGQTPSIYALAVLLLPLLRPVFYWLLDASGHDELLVLMGMLLALVVGGLGFSSVGLSSELGALAMGMMLANHPRSGEVSESLWGLKELFLVGFFLQIGMSGLPSGGDWLFASIFVLVLPLKGLLFYAILTLFHLRARNAFLGALSLTAYSEFGLIVAAGVPMLDEFLVPLALTVALSFVVAAPLNRSAHTLFERFEGVLCRWQTPKTHPDEISPDLSQAKVIVFGMGRTGQAAYDMLAGGVSEIAGIDSDPYQVERHQSEGRHVVLADAEDADFWSSVRLDALEAAILAVDHIDAKLIATRKLRQRGFQGPIITHAMYAEQAEMVREAGADRTYLTLQEAGSSLAGHAIECLQRRSGQGTGGRPLAVDDQGT